MRSKKNLQNMYLLRGQSPKYIKMYKDVQCLLANKANNLI